MTAQILAFNFNPHNLVNGTGNSVSRNKGTETAGKLVFKNFADSTALFKSLVIIIFAELTFLRVSGRYDFSSNTPFPS
jgi:hypothetical protein